MLFDPGAAAPYLALAILAGVFVAFLSERFAADMVAFVGATIALALGLVGQARVPGARCPTRRRPRSG